MIDAGAVVRFACTGCKALLDVDLEQLAIVAGRSFSLIGKHTRCKVTKCRYPGFFVAATSLDTLFILLSERYRTPRWLIGARPSDWEPPKPPEPPPPAPLGIDPVSWASASEYERRRMVRQLRG